MTTPDTRIRQTTPRDIPEIIELCRRVYPQQRPWRAEELEAQQAAFPEGQFVAVAGEAGPVIGMAACLVVDWDDYDLDDSYRFLTGAGRFTNHDPSGRTLYGAEVMVDPRRRRAGIGHALYARRRELVQRLRLARIRAGARLPGLHEHPELDPETYVIRVLRGELRDATLNFQLREGFRVIAVTSDYIKDPQSRDTAAIIEWINREVAPALAETHPAPRFEARPASKVSSAS